MGTTAADAESLLLKILKSEVEESYIGVELKPRKVGSAILCKG